MEACATSRATGTTRGRRRERRRAAQWMIGSALAAGLGIGGAAHAQQPAPGPAADPAVAAPDAPTPEEITVTGSRIQRTNLEGVGPLSILSADDIAVSGLTTLDELLRELPSMGFGSGFDQNGNVEGKGLRFIDLRSLGHERTLVLVNGRRLP